MIKVHQENELSFYRYKPSIFKPFYKNLETLSLRRRVRLLLAYFYGYEVYYIKLGDDYAGYCLVQNGRDRRYNMFATEKDIIVGPYFISENHRGKRLSIILLEYVLKKSRLDFKNAYDYIHKDNIPSIRASESVGFEYYSDANISTLLRSIELAKRDEGEYIVFKYTNE